MPIYLIRHAESEANINLKTQSHASINLSEKGQTQAEQLVGRLPVIEGIIISKYVRTYQTAQPMMQKYHLNAEIDPFLHEFSYLSETKCANTTMEGRKAWVNAYWKRMDYTYRDADDAESFADLYMRVNEFYQKLKSLKSQYLTKNLAVFSHGQFLQLLMLQNNQQRPLSKELMQQFRQLLLEKPIKNTQIFKCELT